MKKRIIYFLALMLMLSSAVYADEINVAVASNFNYTLKKLADDFKVKTGHELRISSASSGKLYAQIQHGAPFDIFLSADEKRAEKLLTEKMAVAESDYVYALGKLVLLSNIEAINDCRDVLTSTYLKRLAIANPDIAPYGLAAKQVLQKLELWQQLRPRIVMGENIAQTLQFVATKNANAGFVAASMLYMDKTISGACIWNIPADMYEPVKQKMVLLNRAKDKSSAQEFMQYIRSAPAREIIKSSGYDVL